MSFFPNRRHGDPAEPAPSSATAPVTATTTQSEQQLRARAAFLFRDSMREGQVHPLMPLLIRYRLQREAP